MAKKKSYTGGSADRRRRGLVGVLVPLTPEQHSLVRRAAGATIPPGPAITRWAASVLEAAAREALGEKEEKT